MSTRDILEARNQLLSDPAFTVNRHRYRASEGLSCLYVGRLTRNKNALILPDIISELNKKLKAGMLVIGDGPVLPELRGKVSELGLDDHFLFTGALYGADQLALYFLSSDLFIMPGKGGLAMNEAIQYGLPVVAGIADGTEKDLVRDGRNGKLTQQMDAPSFARAILEVAGNKGQLKKMGEESFRLANEMFNMDRMKSGFVNAINYLTGRQV